MVANYNVMEKASAKFGESALQPPIRLAKGVIKDELEVGKTPYAVSYAASLDFRSWPSIAVMILPT